MEYSEILSSGEKIRKIRKELGLKQYEITGGEITRNLISIIENDKAALTEKVAKVIANNINKACREKDLEYHVTVKYLLESKDMQAENLVDKYLEKLAVDNFEIVDEIEEFLIIYEVGDKKRVIYEKIGDLYGEIKDYYKSYTYYIKAYESGEKDKIGDEIAILILKLSNCCKFAYRYKEALEFSKLPFKEESDISLENKLKLLLNKIEILKILQQYDSALEEIESIEECYEDLDKKFLFELHKLKGQCYKENKHYRDALEVYRRIKEDSTNEELKDILNINIAIIEIYILLRDNRNIRKYIDESRQFIISNKELYKEKGGAKIFNGLAKGYKFINEASYSAEYYNHCIYAAKRNKEMDILVDALENLFEIYEREQNIEEIDNIKNQLLELSTTETLKNKNKLIFRIIGFYNEMNDKDSISGIVSFFLN